MKPKKLCDSLYCGTYFIVVDLPYLPGLPEWFFIYAYFTHQSHVSSPIHGNSTHETIKYLQSTWPHFASWAKRKMKHIKSQNQYPLKSLKDRKCLCESRIILPKMRNSSGRKESESWSSNRGPTLGGWVGYFLNLKGPANAPSH